MIRLNVCFTEVWTWAKRLSCREFRVTTNKLNYVLFEEYEKNGSWNLRNRVVVLLQCN